MTLKDRKSDDIIAYYGPAATLSIPPHSNAVLILCDIPQDYLPPRYGRVIAVTKTENQAKVTIDGGALIVTIDRGTPISPYLTKNIVTIDNIDVGSDLLLWCPISVALSYPGQTTATKTIILGKAAPVETPPTEPVAEAPAAKGESQSAVKIPGGSSITGKLPSIYMEDDKELAGTLNGMIDAIYERTKDSGEVSYSFEKITGALYTSVIIRTEISAGNTAGVEIDTFVFKTNPASAKERKLYSLTDILGKNAYKLADLCVSRQIAFSADKSFYTDKNGFRGVDADTNFYVDKDGKVTIIFDKYEIASGSAGTPEFKIPVKIK
jgi:hypothetical protein